MARLGAVLSFVLLFLSSALAEPPRDSKAPPPTRDDVAVQLLTSMNAACGWTSQPTTVIATGTVTIEGKSEPLILEAKPGWLRIDTPGSQTVLIVNGSLETKLTAGKPEPLNGSVAASILPLMFPFYTELFAVSDPTLSVTDGGTDKTDASLHIANLASTATLNDGRDSLRQAASKRSVSVATDKLLPLKITFHRMSQETQQLGVDTDAYLGDFRNVDGVMVPFQYEERMGDQSLFVLQVENVIFNKVIPDSDFYLY